MGSEIRNGDGMLIVGSVQQQFKTDYGRVTTKLSVEIRNLHSGVKLECSIEKKFASRIIPHDGRILLSLEQAKKVNELLSEAIQRIEKFDKGYEEYLKQEEVKDNK